MFNHDRQGCSPAWDVIALSTPRFLEEVAKEKQSIYVYYDAIIQSKLKGCCESWKIDTQPRSGVQCSWHGSPGWRKRLARPKQMSWSWCRRPSARPCGSCCGRDCRRSTRSRSRSPVRGRRTLVLQPAAKLAHCPKFPAEKYHKKNDVACSNSTSSNNDRTHHDASTYPRIKHVCDSFHRTVQHQPSDEENKKHHVGKYGGEVHHLRCGKRKRVLGKKSWDRYGHFPPFLRKVSRDLGGGHRSLSALQVYLCRRLNALDHSQTNNRPCRQ